MFGGFVVWHANKSNNQIPDSAHLRENQRNNHTASAWDCHTRIEFCFFILSEDKDHDDMTESSLLSKIM